MAIAEHYNQYEFTDGLYRRVGQSKRVVRHVVDGDSNDTVLTLAADTSPASAAITGSSGLIQTDNFASAKIWLAGANETASDGAAVNYRILLYRRFDQLAAATTEVYEYEIVASGVATVGTALLPVALGSGTATTGDMWCDTITNTVAHSGVMVNSPADNTKGSIEIDLHNACAIEIQGYVAANTTWDAFIQFGEPSVPFDLTGATGLWPRYTESSITMAAGTTGAISTTVAGHKALLVTGLVRGWIVVECTTSLTSGGSATFSVGTDDDDDSICGQGTDIPFDPVNANLLVPTDGADTPVASYVLSPGDVDCLVEFRSNGIDIEYYVNVATLTGGALKFHCWWLPLEPGAFVAAGAGATT